MEDANREPLLAMDSITKTFPGVLALDGASLRVGRGEVHALVGQNGAGKSTLIKVLTGVHTRGGGTILFDGQPVDFRSPHAAQAGGISTIYQEVNLVPLRTVSENVFLAREPKRWGLVDWPRMNREARELLARFGVHIDVTKTLGSYNIAVQQMVALARAMSFDSKLVIMDEPTSSLDDSEVQTLFKVVRQLKDEGVSVIFVSHRLDELYAICDRVSIMRDGKTVEERAMADIGKLELVSKMLGKELGEVQREGQTGFAKGAHHSGKTLLRAKNLERARVLNGVDLEVNEGEIVSLAGLLGSGRTETARVLFGADPLEGGSVEVEGRQVRFKTPADAIQAGLGFSSEDRKQDGIIPYMSVRENLTLALLPRLARNGVVDRAEQARVVDRFIARLGIRTSGPEQKIRELSGGNQQKVLLARWMCLHPKLLILDEPTRGIDVGAKAEIQALIDELAADGLGVLMISSELEEVTEGSDRVIVLRDGHSVEELSGEGLTQDAVMRAMAQGEEPETVYEGFL